MEIISGKLPKPRRCLLYGEHGCGKSTWAASAPSPIFVQCEDGLDDIGADRTPLLCSYTAVGEALAWVLHGEHEYKTVVIDTLDWLEKLIHEHVARSAEKRSIEDFGFGKGYKLALVEWKAIRSHLTAIRNQRRMNVVLLSHAKTEKVEPPDADSYHRYEPDLHKYVAPELQEWCDEVFFMTRDRVLVKRDEGFGKERRIAVGGSRRLIKTTESASHLAKSRLSLPDELEVPEENGFAEYLASWPVPNNPLKKGA